MAEKLPPQIIAGRGIHLVEDAGGEGLGVVIDLSDEAQFRFEALAGPDRLIIDLDRVVFTGGAAKPSAKVVGPVSGHRAGLFLMGQSRIVLDLQKPAVIERIDFVRQNGAVRLVVQVKAVTREAFTARVEADAKRRMDAMARPGSGPVVAPTRSGKPLLVIDPGHGGIDPGASGPKGEIEKELVLAFALALRDELKSESRIEVALTREDDRFLALNERVAFARSRGAAVFVSLHADVLQGEPDVFGASIYTASERASDAAAARAAEKENRADLLAGLDPQEGAGEGVETILLDLARRETRLFSHVLARDAVGALGKGMRLHKTPLRSAGFRVLQAPDMPSLLIELGYLSNTADLAALSDAKLRQRSAKALADALARFLLSERAAILKSVPDSANR